VLALNFPRRLYSPVSDTVTPHCRDLALEDARDAIALDEFHDAVQRAIVQARVGRLRLQADTDVLDGAGDDSVCQTTN
jgi:hypothetical protein